MFSIYLDVQLSNVGLCRYNPQDVRAQYKPNHLCFSVGIFSGSTWAVLRVHFPPYVSYDPNWHISNLFIYLTAIISLAHLRAWASDFILWLPMLYIIQIVYIQLTVDMFLCPYFAATWKMWKCLRNNITWPLSYVTHFWKAMKGRQISLQMSSVYLYMVKHRYSAKLHKGTHFFMTGTWGPGAKIVC